MNKQSIHICENDMSRLRQLTEARYLAQSLQLEMLARLEEVLDRAEILDEEDLPEDVVVMNSRVRLLDLETGRETVHQLVFPAESWGKGEALSVLAPLGVALLGYRVGDVVEARTPGGVRRVKVLALLQPATEEKKIA